MGKPAQETIIYFVTAAQPWACGIPSAIKIGCTSRLDTRLRELERVRGEKLTVIATMAGGFSEEARLHDYFACHETGDNEWYRPDPELLGYIKSVSDGLSSIPVRRFGTMSHRLRDVHLELCEAWRREGRCPTMTSLSSSLGISRERVRQHMKRLNELRIISIDGNRCSECTILVWPDEICDDALVHPRPDRQETRMNRVWPRVKHLSPEDVDVLLAVGDLQDAQRPVLPTRAQVAEKLQKSYSTTMHHLRRLRDDFEAVDWMERTPRSLHVTDLNLLAEKRTHKETGAKHGIAFCNDKTCPNGSRP